MSGLRLGTPEMNFFYVYTLQSEVFPARFYVGFTENLQDRLKTHNAGKVPHTAKFCPWRIKTAVAFTDRERAINFENYLKSPSGRAFARKRL
jgi:putative endonuclease